MAGMAGVQREQSGRKVRAARRFVAMFFLCFFAVSNYH